MNYLNNYKLRDKNYQEKLSNSELVKNWISTTKKACNDQRRVAIITLLSKSADKCKKIHNFYFK